LRIVAPDISAEIMDEFGNRHEIRRKQYEPSDLDGAFLVVAATDDKVLNSLVAANCRERGIIVNSVDQPADCDFHVPSVIRRGEIQIAISTGGHSPAMAGWLRREIEKALSHKLEQGLDIIAAARRRLIESDPNGFEKRSLGFSEFFESDIWRGFLSGDRELLVEEVVEWISSSTG